MWLELPVLYVISSDGSVVRQIHIPELVAFGTLQEHHPPTILNTFHLPKITSAGSRTYAGVKTLGAWQPASHRRKLVYVFMDDLKRMDECFAILECESLTSGPQMVYASNIGPEDYLKNHYILFSPELLVGFDMTFESPGGEGPVRLEEAKHPICLYLDVFPLSGEGCCLRTLRTDLVWKGREELHQCKDVCTVLGRFLVFKRARSFTEVPLKGNLECTWLQFE